MRRILFLILINISVVVSGQVSTLYVSGQNMSDHFRIHNSSSVDEESKIYGSPYADEHWTVGTISFTNINQIVSDHLRLNAYSNELEIFNGGEKMAIIQPFKLKEANVGKRKYIYAFYLYKYGKTDYLSSSYFEVVVEGKMELLKRYYVKIVNNSYVSNYMGGGGDGRNHYNLKSEFFYRVDGNEAAFELEKNKKHVVSLFSDKKDEILSYIKENKLKLNSEEGIEKVFDYYNSL